MTEAEFQKNVIALARTCGWKVAHFRPAMMRSGKWATPMQGDPGFPDLVLARDGQVIFAELKAGTGRLSAPQRAWALELMAGWKVWRPVDWPEIQAVLTNRRIP